MMKDEFFDDDLRAFESDDTDFMSDFKADNYQWDSESFSDDELKNLEFSIDNSDDESFDGFCDDIDDNDFYQ